MGNPLEDGPVLPQSELGKRAYDTRNNILTTFEEEVPAYRRAVFDKVRARTSVHGMKDQTLSFDDGFSHFDIDAREVPTEPTQTGDVTVTQTLTVNRNRLFEEDKTSFVRLRSIFVENPEGDKTFTHGGIAVRDADVLYRDTETAFGKVNEVLFDRRRKR